jgi:phosphate transport system ATP-binding protein
MSATLLLTPVNSTAVGIDSNPVIIDCKIDNLYYGKFRAVRDSHIPIEKGRITAFIGPSGCGKSTALRCLNRMNDLVRGFRFEGHVHFSGQDIYVPGGQWLCADTRDGVPAAESFAMSIFNNVALGSLNRFKGNPKSE